MKCKNFDDIVDEKLYTVNECCDDGCNNIIVAPKFNPYFEDDFNVIEELTSGDWKWKFIDTPATVLLFISDNCSKDEIDIMVSLWCDYTILEKQFKKNT